MLNLISRIKKIHEKSKSKRAVELMASACPTFFELLGYDVLKGDVSVEYWNNNKIEYEAFKEVWEKRHKEKLPEYYSLA